MIRATFVVVGWTVAAQLSAASSAATPAAASVQIVDSTAVSMLVPLRVGRRPDQVTTRFGSSLYTSTIVAISGRANQAYSVRIPQSRARGGTAGFESVTAWSNNARRNIASGYFAITDDTGRDILNLAGSLNVPEGDNGAASVSAMTIGIDYQ